MNFCLTGVISQRSLQLRPTMTMKQYDHQVSGLQHMKITPTSIRTTKCATPSHITVHNAVLIEGLPTYWGEEVCTPCYDPKSYAGRSFISWQGHQDREVNRQGSDVEEATGLPGWGLCRWIGNPPT